MEKKYPGTYKRHLVRPIVRSNAVEKLIKKKGSMSHKAGMPQPKRYEAQQLLLLKKMIIMNIPHFSCSSMYVHQDRVYIHSSYSNIFF